MEETLPGRRSASPIAGTGFIGAVHARSARLAGAHARRRRGLVGRRAPSRPRPSCGAERAFASAEELVAGRRRRRRPHLHAEPPAPPARRGRARGRQARRSARSRWRSTSPARSRLVDAAADAGRVAAVPFVYRYYPTVREARERVAQRRDRPDPAAARHLPAGLAAARRGRQLARRRRAGRRLARVRRHRLALVRPGRVRLRPPHHAAVRAHADRAAASACTPRTAPRSSAAPTERRGPRRRDRGRRRDAVRDRRAARSAP